MKQKAFFGWLWISTLGITWGQDNPLSFWVGGVETMRAKARVYAPGESTLNWKLFDPASGTSLSVSGKSIADAPGWFGFRADSLRPNTLYRYAFSGAAVLYPTEGQFRTLVESPKSFQFLVSSCSFFPNNPAHQQMAKESASFYLNVGDLHYANPGDSLPETHRNAYLERFLNGKAEQKLMAAMPLVYVWDDHDFCGNNSLGGSPCGHAAKLAYQQAVPAYPFYRQQGGIAQEFRQGRVAFLLIDLRSERKAGHIMDSLQMEWIMERLKAHKNAGLFTVLVSSVSWYGNEKDNWGGFPKDRQRLLDFISQLGHENLLFVCGDAHMLGMDDGSGALNFEKHGLAIPLLQAGALLSFASHKGGTYAQGLWLPPLGSGQYARIEVVDDGKDALLIRIRGYRLTGEHAERETLLDYSFCRPLPPVLEVEDDLNIHASFFALPDSSEFRGGLALVRNRNGRILQAEPIPDQGSFQMNFLQGSMEMRFLELQSIQAHSIRQIPQP